MSQGQPSFADFSDRLNALFDKVTNPKTGKPYTNTELAMELEGHGAPITAGYLGQLRLGKKTEPSARLIGAMAAVFGVPTGYFFGETEEADRVIGQLVHLEEARDQGIKGIMARSHGVSPEGLAQIASILDYIRHTEGLDDAAPRPSTD